MTNANRYPDEVPAAGDPVIKVIGIGGAGSNAVGLMASSGLRGVTIIAANTDTQALALVRADQTIRLGPEGRFESNSPEIGRMAAEESLAAVKDALGQPHLVFIAAGMGGCAGTGASPVIARAAREAGALTVGVVTTPLRFEGKKRMETAAAGIAELRRSVDFLMIIPMERLYQSSPQQASLSAVFGRADSLMLMAVSCICDALMRPSLITLDFADVVRLLRGTDMAVMGASSASGEHRTRNAAVQALGNLLLENAPLAEARAALVTITAGLDLTYEEVDAVNATFMNELHEDAVILISATVDESLSDEARITFIATVG